MQLTRSVAALVGILTVLTSCASPWSAVAGVLTLGLGAAVPGHRIEQTYYVGIVDPLDQVPPSLYRITLRGEASVVSNVRLQSGWVQADLVDTLGTKIGFDDDGNLEFTRADGNTATLKPGRGMWLFGPEGFRQAPRDHRLVIMMGADPSAFFDAVSEAMGELSTAHQFDEQSVANQRLAMLEMLDDVHAELDDLPEAKENGGDE